MLTSMLEKAIEIEGLLRIIIDGNPMPETYTLLKVKTAELSEQSLRLPEEKQAPDAETPQADFIMAPPQTEPALPEVVFASETVLPKEEPALKLMEIIAEGVSVDEPKFPNDEQDDLALAEEDDIELAFDDIPEAGFPITDEEEASETPAETRQEAPEAPDIQSREKAKTDFMGGDNDKTTQEAPAQAPVKKIRTLKSRFSLNDRFLYARELFNGNMKTFDSTLEYLEGIDDFGIIENYFYDELEWDKESPNVSSFIDILRQGVAK